MRRLGGQAARIVHRLLSIAIGILVVSGAGFAVLAWWLSAHPIDMPWLATRIEAAGRPVGLRVGGASLAWNGFGEGLDAALDVRLSKVSVRDPDGDSVTVPQVDAGIEVAPLLRGAVRPRVINILHPQIVLGKAGAPMTGTPAQILQAVQSQATPVLRKLLGLARGESGDVMGRVQRINVENAAIVAPPGQGWAVPRLEAAFDRPAPGTLAGSAAMDVRFGTAETDATLGVLVRVGQGITLTAHTGTLRPAVIAAVWPALSQAARLEAPVGGDATIAFDSDATLRSAQLVLHVDSGAVRIAQSAVPLRASQASLTWSAQTGFTSDLALNLLPRPDAPATRLAVHGIASLGDGRVRAHVDVTLDQVDLRELSVLWPTEVAGDARKWLVENVSAGTAGAAHVALDLAAAPDGSDLRLTSAAGELRGSDVTVSWLRPVPPVEHVEAVVHIVDPDTLRADVLGGTQAPEPGAGQAGVLKVTSGSMLITGLLHKDQNAEITARVTGPIPAALALLADKRLHLLSDHPVPLKNPAGEVVAQVQAEVPLDARVTMDQIGIKAHAHLADLSLAEIVAGRALEDGAFDVNVTQDGLDLAGSAELASIPAQIAGVMDFRAGPANQVLQRITVSGQADAREMAAAGLDATSLLDGDVGLKAVYEQRRNGQQRIDAQADLEQAALHVDQIGWRKPAGLAGSLRARVLLDRSSRLNRIEAIEGGGAGFALRADATVAPDGTATLTVSRLVLGGTVAHGTVSLGRSLRIDVSGPKLDLSGRFSTQAQAPVKTAAASDASQPWQIDARFAQAVLARGWTVSGLAAEATGKGDVIAALRLRAETGPDAPVEIAIAPDGDDRAVQVTAADAGAVMRDLGALNGIEGGRMTVNAKFLDTQPGRPLTGLAEVDNFRLRDAPALAKVLQAMTVYGLTQALQGPGMGFVRLTAPFTYRGGVVHLDDARAYNPSLGLTARGDIDLGADRLDIQGTIVPAYYLNTLPGRIPVIGKLFSPEKGGGMLAARFAASGPMKDPKVTVNALSALTPGFLRGLFGR